MDDALLWEKVLGELRRRPNGEVHTQQVVNYARQLRQMGEAGDESLALKAAMLHDVGIPAALAKHGSADGPYQEAEGERLARQFLGELGYPQPAVLAVADIVGHHHQRRAEPSPEFKLVWDADALVNSDFNDLSRKDEVLATFYTEAGRELARRRFRG